ncbi:hypothetical protein BsIDN1_09570 [Bacillus safensis]|uniref:Uncharacterized protein n=1 Tax=Bacillus safensis TaxID=561879 RepID=A0A5S9M600_BACIA|nr:hypothetical protein BsIDN1_09570 [Bacillus safensis]
MRLENIQPFFLRMMIIRYLREKNILVNERERLVQKQKEIEETIKRLDFKIESYEDIIHNHEKNSLIS